MDIIRWRSVVKCGAALPTILIDIEPAGRSSHVAISISRL